MKNKFSPFVLISILAIVASVVVSFIVRDIKLFITISMCLLAISFVFAIIGLITAKRMEHKGRGIAVLTLILSLVGLVILLIINTAFKMFEDPKATEEAKICDKAKDCVDKNGVSTCSFDGIKQIEMKCNTSILKDNQMK